MPDLGAYLLTASGQVRSAGRHDCCTFPADWALLNGWPDPMAAWRGGYATDDEASALIREAGGLCALFDEGMGGAGMRPTDEPTVGDIGVIHAMGFEAGAIFTGKRWAFAAARGVAASSVEPACIARCWSIAHG